MLTAVLIMDKNIGIIGHVDHGSTCLSAAVVMALSMQEQKVIVVVDEEQEQERGLSFKHENTFEITNPYLFEPVYFEHDSNRNRKRKQERSKQKIKKSIWVNATFLKNSG